MKTIVINDSNGHTNVYAYNQANLLKVLQHVDEIDMLQEGEIPENPTMEQLEQLVDDCDYINQRGGQVYILDTQEEYDPFYNPLE